MVELTPQRIAAGLTGYVVLLFSISFHEAAHAWSAHALGDDTARSQGRITLDPRHHIDPVGTVLMPLVMFLTTGMPFFGWAKPTPYDPSRFGRGVSLSRGHMVVAGAGPLSNAVLALAFTAVLWALVHSGVAMAPPVRVLVATGIELNVALAAFNLIPVPPLDGSKIASWGLPRALGEAYDRVMEPYGQWILVGLFVTPVLGWVLWPVVRGVTGLLYRLVY